ncbi:hypothetical protein A7Q26_00785 [Sphingobium sp. TCM1]|nr:hypothetical protein A7Q26_00785 [Sphingobium sp. TCM1]
MPFLIERVLGLTCFQNRRMTTQGQRQSRSQKWQMWRDDHANILKQRNIGCADCAWSMSTGQAFRSGRGNMKTRCRADLYGRAEKLVKPWRTNPMEWAAILLNFDLAFSPSHAEEPRGEIY